MARPLGLTILLVEDDDAIRESLKTFFEIEGYEVEAVVTAEQGLEVLKREGNTVHLLLTDYQLPGETGSWLIRQAKAHGLLSSGASLLFTAHPRPSDAGDVKVLRKPLDLDDLLREVEDALAPVRAAEVERARDSLKARTSKADGCIALTLFISARSPSSLRAVRKLRGALEGFDAANVDVRIVDLSTVHDDPDSERVVFTPTLLRRHPLPRVALLGCDDMDVVEGMLLDAGVPRTTTQT
jgi:CheY-like chemotaxis protein